MRIKYFERYELKYLLNREQVRLIQAELLNYLNPDQHGDESGQYPITSLYYDTADYRAYWNKIEGHRFRRKVRIRVYGDQVITPESPVFVEIKQRNNKTLQKKRIVVPYQAALALCGTGEAVALETAADHETMQEVQYLASVQQLQPACIVSYDRYALEGSEYDPGLRVTFDTNLKGRTHSLSLLSADQSESYYFLPPDWAIMEVKVNVRVPYWLTELIGKYSCTLRRVSKYCSALEKSKILLREQHPLS
jgi:SPX domain protein involved in polyphosphate accumulation